MNWALYAACLAIAGMCAGSSLADVSGGFKRVKPPSSGARNLINIHVEPAKPVERVLSYVPDIAPAPETVAPSPVISAPDVPSDSTASWFWAPLSPSISAGSPNRLLASLAVLGQNQGKPAARAPKLDRVAAIQKKYGAEILKATAGTSVSPALVLAVISVESAGKPAAKSHAGAVGLMQLMPATAKRFGVSDRTDAAENIRGGVAYLQFLLEEFDGDALLTLAAYNAGEGAVQKQNGVPNYSETRAYVPKVVAAWSQARLLCLSPPVSATDPCLFTGVQIAQQ